jgi:1,4-dihydroxy-2-naphthoate octaprenyltransferase
MEPDSLGWEIVSFVRHLRLSFQLVVAPAAYLLGVCFSDRKHALDIALQFVNVHVLLLGGASAYNSYYDKDRGPVEGLSSPPRMKAWMAGAALGLQGLGAMAAFACSPILGAVYLASVLGFSLAYSHPAIRLKGRPVAGLVAVGVFGALTPFAMGFLASGGGELRLQTLAAALGIALIVVATFPLAQVHQIPEDRERGDLTFTVRFGPDGVRRLFAACFPAGVVLVAWSLAATSRVFTAAILLLGGVAGCLLVRPLRRLAGTFADYETLVRLKTASALCLNCFLLFLVLRK